MKVIAINGSPKKEGNTFQALSMLGRNWLLVELILKFFTLGINRS